MRSRLTGGFSYTVGGAASPPTVLEVAAAGRQLAVNAHLSPPPVPSTRSCHHPCGTACHRFHLDGDCELHIGDLACRRPPTASPGAWLIFGNLHGPRYVGILRSFAERSSAYAIWWTKIYGRRFAYEYSPDEHLQTKFCRRRFGDKILHKTICNDEFGADLCPVRCGLVRLFGLCGADRSGFTLRVGATHRVLCHTLQSLLPRLQSMTFSTRSRWCGTFLAGTDYGVLVRCSAVSTWCCADLMWISRDVVRKCKWCSMIL